MNFEKSKKGNVFSDTIKYSFVRYVTLFTSLFNTMLLSRIRSLGEYGTFSQMLLVSNLVVSIVALGIPSSMNYYVAKETDKMERNRVVSIYFTLNTLISVAIAIVLNFSIGFICSYFNNPSISNYAYFLMLLPWVSIIQTSLENILIVYDKVNILSIYKLSLGVLTLSIAGMTFFWHFNFSEYILLYTALQIIYSILVYVIVFFATNRTLRFCLDFTVIKSIIAFSIPLGIGMMLNTLNVEIDKLMIGHWFSVDEMAIYTNASTELPIYILCSSLTVISLPVVARKLQDMDYGSACSIWKDTFSFGYIILSFLDIGIIVFSREVISLIYSDKYLPGQSVFVIYCIAILIYRCTYYGMFLNAGGQSKPIMIASILTVVTNIVLNPIFYKLVGFEGPAIASVISLMVSNVFLLVLTKKHFAVGISSVIPWKTILVSTVANIVLGAIFATLKYLLPIEIYVGGIIESIILACIWGIVYFVFAYKPLKQLSERIKSYK